MDRLERNKQTAMAFYDLMFNRCKPREAVERYTGGVYHERTVGFNDVPRPFLLPHPDQWRRRETTSRA